MAEIIVTTKEDLKNILIEVLNENKQETPTPQDNELLTRNETAKMLGVSLVTLNNWSKRGIIQSYRINTRIRYKRGEILQSLNTVKKYGRM